MPFSGSAPNQTYSRSDGTRTGAAVCAQEKAAALNDTAALADLRENDLATAINSLWLRNGGNQPSADLPMNSHKFTGMADGTDSTDSISLGQVQDGSLIYAAVDGSANAIELTLTPASAGPVEGMSIVFIPDEDSTSTVTVDEGNGAVALQYAGAALSGGELQAGLPARITFDGTAWQLENSAVEPASRINITDSGGYFSSGTVEGALQEVGADIIPAGTKMLFVQTSAPTGWTKDTSNDNNSALRLVTGSASTGGSVDFTTALASQTPAGTVGDTTLTTNQIPLHGHPYRQSTSGDDGTSGGGSTNSDTNVTNHAAFTGTPSSTTGQMIGGTGGGQSHTHTFTGNAINLAVKYVDVIRATKD